MQTSEKTGAVAAAVLALAVPVATWWLVGDLSEVPASEDPTYLVRPWRLGGLEPVLGVAGLAATLLTTAWLVRGTFTGRYHPLWWLTWGPVIVAGLIVGFGWRVVTAASIGANIGAGLILLFGAPLVALLLLWAVGWTLYLVRRSRGPAAVPVP